VQVREEKAASVADVDSRIPPRSRDSSPVSSRRTSSRRPQLLMAAAGHENGRVLLEQFGPPAQALSCLGCLSDHFGSKQSLSFGARVLPVSDSAYQTAQVFVTFATVATVSPAVAMQRLQPFSDRHTLYALKTSLAARICGSSATKNCSFAGTRPKTSCLSYVKGESLFAGFSGCRASARGR
jgi:hypothetical protein